MLVGRRTQICEPFPVLRKLRKELQGQYDGNNLLSVRTVLHPSYLQVLEGYGVLHGLRGEKIWHRRPNRSINNVPDAGRQL